MIYAVKSVDGREVNKVFDTWDECKQVVLGHNSIYKSFPDANTEECRKFIAATITAESYGKGYDPIDVNKKAFNGRYLFTRYENKDYSISIYQTKQGKRVTCKGYNLPTNKNLLYSFTGEYKKNKEYGMDFIVESFDTVIEDSKDGIVAYLSSGLFKGVGKKKAEAIYKEFGPRTMSVIENEPIRLKYVKGFSESSALALGEAYKNTMDSKEITQYLLKFGVSQKYAIDLYKHHGGKNALYYIKKNPYQLCRKYRAITFDVADDIAKDCKLPLNNPDRIEFAIIHVLNANKITGNIGMEYQDFCMKVFQMVGSHNVSKEELLSEISHLVNNNSIVIKKIKYKDKICPFVFSRELYDIERNIAADIIRIKNGTPKHTVHGAKKLIEDMERERGIKLDPLQVKAIVSGLETSAFSVITGGPGMGKTYIAMFIAQATENIGGKAILLSPTGCAARRMEESTMHEASTIHSYIGIKQVSDDLNSLEAFLEDDEVIIEDSTVIVDEVSMLDTPTAGRLFNAIKKGCRVILIGDIDQLPSVGPGAVLRDIIDSGVIDVTVLKKIYRQKENAKISENAHVINEGSGEILEGSDFHIHEYENMEDVKNVVANLYVEKTKKYGFGNVMCLCPYKEHTAGVFDMNKTLQDLVNPATAAKKELKVKGQIFREGDLVMHINCNTEDASNGDVGIINYINVEDQTIDVEINNHIVVYEEEDLKNLMLAYARTVHKAQGQQAPSVIFMLTNFHRGMLYKNIPYVAISRASEDADFVGQIDALYSAMANEVKNERVTVLGYFLAYLGGKFVKVA